MTWWWSATFLPFTVASVTSELPGYEAAKVAVYDEHPYVRSWRSNNQVTQQTIRCTFGSAVTIHGVALFNLNGPLFQLTKSSNNGASWTDLTSGSATIQNRTAEKYLAYHRYCTPVQATGVTDCQVIVLAQTPVDGKSYLEIGSVVFLGAREDFPRPPRLGMQEQLVRPYDQSGLAKRAAGPWRSEMEWQMLLRNQQHLDAWRRIALLGEDRTFLIAKSAITTPQVYLMRYEGALQFEDQKLYQRVNPRWVEIA